MLLKLLRALPTDVLVALKSQSDIGRVGRILRFEKRISFCQPNGCKSVSKCAHKVESYGLSMGMDRSVSKSRYTSQQAKV